MLSVFSKFKLRQAEANHSRISTAPVLVPTTGGAPVPAGSDITWGPWVGVLYAVLVFFAAQILAEFIVAVYPLAKGWSVDQIEHWLADSVIAQFWYVLVAEALTFYAIFWFIRRRKRSLAVIGFKRPRFRDAGIAVLGFLAYFAVYAVLLSVVTKLIPSLNINQPQDIGFTNANGTEKLVLTFMSLVIFPPLVEEVVFRGFVFSGLRTKLPIVVAAIATSLLFASAHLQFGSGQPLLWVAAIDTFTLSMVLCYLRFKTGSLWSGIFVHALKNGLAFVSLFLLHVR